MAHLIKVCVKISTWTTYQVCVNGGGYLAADRHREFASRLDRKSHGLLPEGEMVYGYYQALDHILQVRENAHKAGEYASYWKNVPLDIEETTGTTTVYAQLTMDELEALVMEAGYQTDNVFWDLDNDVPEYMVMVKEEKPGSHLYAQVQNDGTINGESVFAFFSEIGRLDILEKRYSHKH